MCVNVVYVKYFDYYGYGHVSAYVRMYVVVCVYRVYR